MDRAGVLDLGTNTFRLLISSYSKHHRLQRERIERRVVRMGEGFVGNRRISEAPFKRARIALKEYASLLQRYHVDCVRGVATGVFREAENADQVIEFLKASFPYPIRVISGVEEGAYTLNGVRAGLELPQESDVLVIDIGGGSTELIRMNSDGDVQIRSIPVGVVYLKERFADALFSEPEGYGLLQNRIDQTLDDAAHVMAGGISSKLKTIGTGGTITTLAFIHLGLKRYLPEKIHGSSLSAGDVEQITEQARKSVPQTLQKRFHLEKGRADLILFGGTLLLGILKRLADPEIQVCDYGLLEGAALDLLEK